MKPPIRLAVAALACLVDLAHAKTITVDNKPGAVAMYTDFASAAAAADPGDTILLAGSPTPYGTHNLYKRINIIGPGYFLAENAMKGTDSHSAIISLNLYRKFGVDSSGYALKGLVLPNLNTQSWNDPDAGATASTAPSVFISRCQFNQALLNGFCRIEQSFSTSQITLGFGANESMIRNSRFLYTDLNRSDVGSAHNCVFEHCVFGASLNNSQPGQESNAFISCIFLGSAPSKGNISYSVVGSGSVPAGVGNKGPFSSTALFKDFGRNWDIGLELATSSPAKGAGFNGTDAGIFGGDKPYVLSGLPNRPRITQLIVPSKVTEGSGLPFQVTAEGR